MNEILLIHSMQNMMMAMDGMNKLYFIRYNHYWLIDILRYIGAPFLGISVLTIQKAKNIKLSQIAIKV